MPRSPPAAESRHRLCGVLQHLQRPTAVPISLDAAAAAAPVAALSTSLRQLGARAAKVRATALGLGGVCWNEDDVQWMQNVHAAVKLGVKYFDTAPAYGNGLSEHRMGLALRTYERDSFVLSTKVGYQLLPITPNHSQLLPTTPNYSQSVPITPNESQLIPITPNESQSLPITPNHSQSLPITPNHSELLPIKPNESQGRVLPPTGRRRADATFRQHCPAGLYAF
eukprot:SAG31_NODE_3862_length_3810_cov_32.413096_6_plen_225_part_00